MKKSLFLICFLSASVSHAQDTLSRNDYNRLSYKLKAGINPEDSVSIAANFAAIAPQMFNDTKMFREKPLRDYFLMPNQTTV